MHPCAIVFELLPQMTKIKLIAVLSMLAARGFALDGIPAEATPFKEIAWTAENIRATDGKFTSPQAGTLRIETGRAQPWPGLTISAPAGGWDWSRFGAVRLEVRNTGTQAVSVYCRVDNAGADGQRHCVSDCVSVAPGRTESLRVALNRTQPGK